MNLPNKLSLMRIIFVPIIALIMVFPFAQFNIVIPEYNFQNASLSLVNIIVLLLFITASITDFLDGYIARKHNLITTFGKFIDPIADKLLVNTMFILFAAFNTIPVIPVLIMLWRDTIVDGLRMNASSKGIVVAAGNLGKLKTVSQMLAIIFILLNNLPFENMRFPMSDFMLWIATITSFVSGVAYFIQLKDVVLESK